MQGTNGYHTQKGQAQAPNPKLTQYHDACNDGARRLSRMRVMSLLEQRTHSHSSFVVFLQWIRARISNTAHAFMLLFTVGRSQKAIGRALHPVASHIHARGKRPGTQSIVPCISFLLAACPPSFW